MLNLIEEKPGENGTSRKRERKERKRGENGRVEEWRGGVGTSYRSGPFVCRGFTSRTLPRFHSPLIEPGVRICRTRLSDKDSCLRTREASRSPLEPEQPQHLVQVMVREA